jgi:hypothetical protein
MEMRGSRELKNRGTAVEIVAPLQKHGTGRMIGFKLSEYTRWPRYEDELDRCHSHSETNGRFCVSFGQFSIFDSNYRKWRKVPKGQFNCPRELSIQNPHSDFREWRLS